MALPSSGVISLSDFNTELGNAAGTTISLNDTAVRDLISKALNAQSGFSEFYGASAVGVDLQTASASSLEFGTATATLTAESDGEVSGVGSTGLTTPDWWSAAPDVGVGADYEIRATLLSGTTPTSGTLGTWLSLSSNRSWSMVRSTDGTSSCSLTIEIRDTATSTVQGTATWSLSATKSSI